MQETPQSRVESEQHRELDGTAVASQQTPDLAQLEEQCPEAKEYVSQLIARMKGTGPTTLLPAAQNPAEPKRKPRLSLPKAVKPERKPEVAAPSIPKRPATEAAEPPSPAADTPAQFNRSVRNPERTTDLKRLREAANLSATSILHAHELQSATRKAYTDLTMAVASMATSLVLVSLSHQVVSVAYGCAILTFAQAAWSTWSYLRRTDLLRTKTTPDVSLSTQES